jgi:hypothetical protein
MVLTWYVFNDFSPTGGTKWDSQLSQLKRDMQHLRQQDMALLGHLLQINQVRQTFRVPTGTLLVDTVDNN